MTFTCDGSLTMKILRRTVGQAAEHHVAGAPVGIFGGHQTPVAKEPQMREDLMQRLTGVGIGRQYRQFHIGMARGEAHHIGPRIARRPQHTRANYFCHACLPLILRRENYAGFRAKQK